MNFDIDPLFGLKICLPVDQAIQLFLTSCQESEDLDKVNFRYLDSSFDQECIEKGRFSCNPSPLLLNLFDAVTQRMQTEGGGGGKRQRRNAVSNPKQEDAGDNKAELIQNPDKSKYWILYPDEDYKKVFLRPIWSENPPPDLNGSDKSCCPRFNNFGYCLKNCNRSHRVMNNDTLAKYDGWQKKCRDSVNRNERSQQNLSKVFVEMSFHPTR